MIKTTKFFNYLDSKDYSENTRIAYKYILKEFANDGYTKTDLQTVASYKNKLINKGLKPSTINLRLQVLNAYNTWDNHPEYKIKQLPVQQKQFIENVISDEDYNKLLAGLYNDNNFELYFFIKVLSQTGCRVHEAFKITLEDIHKGFADIPGKGRKYRRVWFPAKLRTELLSWRKTGNLWQKLTLKNIKYRVKSCGRKYHINEAVLHCHGFRHYFGLKYIKKTKDIATLSTLLGHASIATTTIYLKRTNNQMQKLINRTVDW